MLTSAPMRAARSCMIFMPTCDSPWAQCDKPDAIVPHHKAPLSPLTTSGWHVRGVFALDCLLHHMQYLHLHVRRQQQPSPLTCSSVGRPVWCLNFAGFPAAHARCPRCWSAYESAPAVPHIVDALAQADVQFVSAVCTCSVFLLRCCTQQLNLYLERQRLGSGRPAHARQGTSQRLRAQSNRARASMHWPDGWPVSSSTSSLQA